ncbi:uncharacterized protein LOC133190225 [Saccostrea echinata]|uniref:uncharacterized protein LOC133190225 n=1 Tax=Saccostrea echinata TaxID=191078 RepID=UPI002A7EFF4C|nr:uncharacterized protein LOC133190225 [Saccostrea echinata]
MRNKSFVALLISLQIIRRLAQNVIETRNGKIQGLTDQWVTSFLGIRYALAPIESRRFAPPVPIPAWNGTLQALNYGPICMQAMDILMHKFLNNLKISEDCLNMNVFVPVQKDKSKLPVLIYVHPGQFQYGAGAIINGSFLALETGSVVVTINYRLGIFGFALFPSLPSKNFGIQDQILAIKWVRNNIVAFGGDGDNIAILTDSVMAKALHYSSTKEALFSKIISLPFDIPYSLQRADAAEIFVSDTKLKTICNSTSLLPCVHEISPEDLLSVSLNQSPWTLPHFRPVLDDDIVKGEDSQNHRYIEQVHLNVVAPSYIYRKKSVIVQQRQYPCTQEILQKAIHMLSSMTSSNASSLLETFYFPDDVTANSICNEVLRLLYDFSSVSSINNLNHISGSALVFLALLEPYYVLQGGTSDPLCIFSGGGEGCDSDATTVFVLSAVKNFLQHGYPSSDIQITWRPYTKQSKNHLIYNGYKTSAANKSRWPLVQQENLWLNLAPAFKKSCYIPSKSCQCPATTDWGMSEKQLEILLYCLVFCCLLLTFVTLTLTRILCHVNKKGVKAAKARRNMRKDSPSNGGHHNGACHEEVEDSKF